MAYTLIPGVRQDHRGRHYQLATYPNGKVIEVPCTVPPLDPKHAAAMEQVVVETQSTLRLNKDKQEGEKPNLPWVETALLRGSLFKEGDTFVSLAVYQGATA